MAQPGKNRTRCRHSQVGAHMETLAGPGWAQLRALRWQRRELLLPPPPPPLSFFEQLLHFAFHGFSLWGGGPSLLNRASPVPGSAGGSEETCQLPRSGVETGLSKGGGPRGKGPEDLLPGSVFHSKHQPRLAKGRVAPLWRELWAGRPGPRSGQIRDLQGSRAATCRVDTFSPSDHRGDGPEGLGALAPLLGSGHKNPEWGGVHVQAQAKTKEDS